MPPVLYSRKSSRSPTRALALISHRSSIVGRPRHQGVMVGMGQKDSYVGYVQVVYELLRDPSISSHPSVQRRGPVEAWYFDPQVPHRARYRHQLG